MKLSAVLRNPAALAVAALITLASAPPARAEWIPYLDQYWFDPLQPTVADTTSIVFYSFYPFDCGEIANVQQPDPHHLSFTIRSGGCADTTSRWTRTFELGVLPEGLQWLHVEITVEHPSGPTEVLRDSIEFMVHGASGPPPPPPPPPPHPPYTFMSYISQVTFDPAYPNITEPVDIAFKGWTPFPCGDVVLSVIDPSHVGIVVTEVPGCSDTTQSWTRSFSLGLLPEGPHDLNVALRFARGDSVVDLAGVLSFHVFESPSGPPPPEPGPPIDSLDATLSAARPNPFATTSDFGVSLDGPARAEIAVYDVSGRRVSTLFEGELPRGTSHFSWDGRRKNGERAPGGIYFYRLMLPGRIVTRRVVLLGAP